MATQSINFETEVLTWIEKEATKTGHGISFMVNYFCRKAMEEKIKERPEMLSCVKHPGSVYSSKLGQCPLCAEEQTIKEIEGRDDLVKKKRVQMTNEKEAILNRMQEVANQINSLDAETEGYQDKYDGLSKEFNELRTRKGAIVIELAELI